MHPRTWIPLLAGLNVVLAGGIGFHYFKHHRQPNAGSSLNQATSAVSSIRTNFVVRRLNFTWQEVESADYVTYINNLRQIGCPETTIRDLIVADVDQLYAHRRASEAVVNDFEWWRTTPNTAELERVAQKQAQIEEERRSLLTKLLGPGWDDPREEMPAPVVTGINLSGPLLGDLPSETKDSIYSIAQRAKQRRDAYLQVQRQLGDEINAAEMARMRQEMRAELAQLLNAEQMEEFLLRYSETAEQMRREFRGLELTPDEFRNIFRLRDPLEQEAALLGQEGNPSVDSRLVSLRTQAEEEVRRTLGQERHFFYKLNQDPIFRETQSRVQNLGISTEVLYPLYQVNQETEAERNRIRNDPTLTADERIEALAEVQADQQKAVQRLLGPEDFQRWLDAQPK